MSDRDNLSDRIAQLRQILPELRARLEAAEEYRALRQLDERENNQNPLEAVDGVLLRGRLARRLEATNRYWRALVRIEAAIADLEGEGRDEQPRLIGHRETAAEPIGPPEKRADVAREARAHPEVTPPPTPKPNAKIPATAAVPASAGADKGAQAQSRAPAASQASPSRASEPRPAAPARPAASVQRPDARTASVSVTSPVPTSLNLIAGDSSERHRTILDRIRPISSLAGAMGGEEASAAPSRGAMWSRDTPVPLPPAIDAPPATATSDAIASEDKDTLAALRIGAVAGARTASASAGAGDHGPTVVSMAVQTPATEKAGTTAAPNRLDTLERELTRLIRDDGSTVESLDAQASDFGASRAPAEHMTSLEPDVRDDLEPGPDVQEAEVTIVKLQGAAAEATSLAGAELRSRVEIRPAPRLTNRGARRDRTDSKIAAKDDDADVVDDGLAIEEAVVEIIVPGRRAGDGSGSDP